MKKYAPALLDVVLVIVFAALGRASHDEGLTLAGLANTAWPFLGGLTVGWLATAALYKEKFDPWLVVPTGVIAWVSTVVVGMLLRVITGQGTAGSFIVVASIVLGVFLLGWRLLAGLWLRRRVDAA
ncbi:MULTISPECIES: DUF3054 domain-containing protein [Rhodococcus]|uniref:DUF3054 domain-containing protein n=1 Tax=Rhodococcus aetherivorans TaxID=191292 RepID=A0A059MI52_9NOCA|nr:MULTISPECIES: DUF3054 domain-containing protein [Rhodococcus]ETT23675.1 Protein of unknown function DUF3054 [Rhodococcus rhodochrous ATCC 21198]NCL76600.1 hypothetical protein [Rhodococcus sp. YH1]AKE91576.1 membrane protein [Rhodococcus aetherivorans]ANZ23589.1 hypothetical protein A4U64_01905 [Rhodococcus sp. WB1]KDE10616.1 membrane protein [Rhodococcus aetherivorans]